MPSIFGGLFLLLIFEALTLFVLAKQGANPKLIHKHRIILNGFTLSYEAVVDYVSKQIQVTTSAIYGMKLLW